MKNHSCRRGEEEERVGEDGVRNGGVWKAIYRESGSKKWLGGHKCSKKTW